MPIIVLSDVILSNSVISAGVRGKNMRLNARVPVDSGDETIKIVWSRTMRQFELGTVPMRISQWQAIEALHEITEGGAFGFLMSDPKDNVVSTGVASAVSSTVFQLQKRYIDVGSSRYKDRIITRPRAAGFVITNSGTPISGASYTLDVTTGRITIPSAPTAANLAWSGPFYVPVHFMEDTIDWDLIAGGSSDQRLLAGPSVVVQEIRE
jgi:uncharacterized protein (TIGR02217 family)